MPLLLPRLLLLRWPFCYAAETVYDLKRGLGLGVLGVRLERLAFFLGGGASSSSSSSSSSFLDSSSSSSSSEASACCFFLCDAKSERSHHIDRRKNTAVTPSSRRGKTNGARTSCAVLFASLQHHDAAVLCVAGV